MPQDYLNVAKVLKLSRMKTIFKILLPATLPYMFTGYRLSLGIAWLVIAALSLMIVSFVVLAHFTGAPPGSSYTPAHIEEGVLVPGTTQ